MFHRYDNIKRAIALLGVMFTLLSSSPYTHCFCQLAECSTGYASHGCHQRTNMKTDACPDCYACRDAHACQDAQVCRDVQACRDVQVCRGAHGCLKTRLETTSSLPADCEQAMHSKNNGRECPCPSNCWCHQTPDPLAMPKSTSSAVELVFSEMVHWFAAHHAAVDCDFASLPRRALTMDLSADSAADRCTQLCRFLI